jgi:ParB-like chromosome segregation protein Spo0J
MTATMEEVSPEVAGEDTRIEGLLTEWGLKFDYDEAYPLRKIDAEHEDSQVREQAHRAPRETTDEFTTQLRGQIQQGRIHFPPIVCTHNGRLIDGNTRKAAAEANGLETFPVYLVKLDRADQGKVLGAALNQMGGRRLTAEEALAAAEKMMNDDISDEAIARTLGRSVDMVRNYRKERMFRETAKRVGIKEDAPVKRSVQRVLADVKHDEPFRAATEVVVETKASASDAKALLAEIGEARSEAEELEVIEKHRAKLRPSGPPPPRKASHSAAKRAGQRLDALLAASAPAAELAPAALRSDLEPKWIAVHDLATGVLAAFAELPPDEAPADTA